MASPDTREIELISEFRSRLTDLNLKGVSNTDHDLLRWIRVALTTFVFLFLARNNDLNEAEKMIRQSMKWREENGYDNILSWTPPERFTQDIQVEFAGYDSENSPVLLLPFGKWDLKKCVELGEKDDYNRYCDHLLATLTKRMEGKVTSSGQPVTQFVLVVDYTGLSFRTLASVDAVEMTLKVMRSLEANFPETANACTRLMPIMSPATVEKVKIFSSDVSKWKPVLLANIPASILPPFMGGTNVNSIFNQTIVSSTCEDEPEDEDMPFLDVYVPAGDKLEICFEVAEGYSTINWAFKTEKYDIAFSVNCDGKAYIEKHRVNSHEELQEGTIKCETPGDYIFTFDNSYSRMRSKQLSYRVDIITPSGNKTI